MMIVNDATSWSITQASSIMLPESSIMLLKSSIMLLDNIYTTGVTHDDHHIENMISVFSNLKLNSETSQFSISQLLN